MVFVPGGTVEVVSVYFCLYLLIDLAVGIDYNSRNLSYLHPFLFSGFFVIVGLVRCTSNV